MIEVTPTSELPALYREWAKEDPIFHKAADYIENKGRAVLGNENKRLKELLGKVKFTNKEIADHQRLINSNTVNKLRNDPKFSIGETTARNVIIAIDNLINGRNKDYSYDSGTFKRLRQEAGLTIKECAELTEYSASHISNLEKGHKPCNQYHVRKLKSKLNLL